MSTTSSGSSYSPIPTFRHYGATNGGDDDDAVQTVDANGMDDVSKIMDNTSDANPSGSVVKVTANGDAVYNDSLEQIVFNPDGRITVLDRAAANSQALKVNFTIKDGMLTYHNPAWKAGGKEPEYLTVAIPKEGMEFNLSGGTTLYVEPNNDGTFDAHITNTLGVQTNASTDPTPGFVANFRGLGSDETKTKGFQKNVNVDGAVGGGNTFKSQWEQGHPTVKGKQGDAHRVWVTSMYSTTTWSGTGRDLSAKEHPDDNPGGGKGAICVRSDSTYDTKNGCGKRMRYIWNDLSTVSTTAATKEKYDNDPWAQIMGVPFAATADNPQDSVDLLDKAKAGAQAFDNPDDPSSKGTSLFGSGAVAGDGSTPSADSTAASTDAGSDSGDALESSEASHSYGSSSLSFADFLADLDSDEEKRKSGADATSSTTGTTSRSTSTN